MYIDKSNEVLMNHYRKQEIIIANGTFQKYLRLNHLIPELQELVDNKKISVVSAEHIRKYGKEKNFKIVFNENEVDKYFAGISKK